MSDIKLESYLVDLRNGMIDQNGKVSIPQCVVEFDTHVIDAIVSLQSVRLAYQNRHYIRIAGAGVENIEHKGNKVEFEAWAQFYENKDTRIYLPDSKLILAVIAKCE